MKTTIERIEAGKILPPDQLTRLGLGPRQILRVVVETLDDVDDAAVAADFAGRSDDEIMEIVDEEIAACRREKRGHSTSA